MYTRLYAKEARVNLVLAGHYRTEAPGIRALAERTARQFEVDWEFVEDDPIG
jgi:putative NIF3 family GTP cyclohydrolase 1 type 2